MIFDAFRSLLIWIWDIFGYLHYLHILQQDGGCPKQVVGLILSKHKKRPYVWPTIEETVIWLSVFDLPNRLEWFGSHATNSMEGFDLEKMEMFYKVWTNIMPNISDDTTHTLRAKIHKKMYFEKIIIDKKFFNKYFAP